MRIGIVSQWYPPERVPTPAPTAAGLVERGHEVKVLTGFPNYPTGRIFPGYCQRWGHTEADGAVEVRRVPLFPNHDTNGVKRAANFLSFASTSSASLGFLDACDVVYVYGTPMTAAAAAMAARALRGKPFVVHVQDLWPESVVDSGMAGGAGARAVLARVIGGGLRPVYRWASHLVAIAPHMKELLVERGVPAEKVSVVPNWAPVEHAAPPGCDRDMRLRLGRPDRTLAVFAGNVGQMQDVETIVRAAALCRDDTPLDVAVVGAGTCLGSTRALAADLGATNVRFLDPVDTATMAAVYGSSDYQLVTLKDRPVFHGTIPSKLAAALAAGCPIITTAPGDVASLCERGRFGFTSPPEDAPALAGALRRAAAADGAGRARMRRAAWDFYWQNMSASTGIDALEAILGEAAGAAMRGRDTGERKHAHAVRR